MELEPYKRCLGINGIQYRVRLIPSETIRRGEGEDKGVGIILALDGVREIVTKKGTFETRSTLEGEELEDWVKAGRFEEIYTFSMVGVSI